MTTAIGMCLKHGRNLASCEECGPNKRREFFALAEQVGPMFEADREVDRALESVYWQNENRAEVARLRAAGELRVACPVCKGTGTYRARYEEVECTHCNGTGWKWSEKR